MLNIQDVSDIPHDEQLAYKKFIDALKESDVPTQEYVRMSLSKLENETLEQSKIGGVPFLKSLDDIPVDIKEAPMMLLAQINLSELPEGQTVFPSNKGMLQFWISGNDEGYGMGIESLEDTKNSKLIFIEDVTTTLTLDEIQSHFSKFEFEETPISGGAFKISYSLGKQYLSPADYRFQEIAVPIWNEVNPDMVIESFFEGHDGAVEAIYETLLPEQPNHQLGGYPYFTQEDPREFEEELQVYDQLLLQIDTDNEEGVDIAWGDGGISNILLKSEDLKAMNFEHYIYTWDTL
ncbi:DUF1963 domain-containing protein [Macrococcus caseolyticus]|uniref:YwqG family protein n=1 Tax=Macrococcoides caseolyticum TaxID=69966 RepID=UPI0024BCE1F0|nr:DUF1963 domain-containing protein [Macrococcus caseolyticus]MDJ1110221.1 DUF1963 domain-containing protein [Macrococcus caseolyticus]